MGMNKAKYAEIGRKIRNIPMEKPCMSYEWEELVEKLCASDDSGLHTIGIKELGKIMLKRTENNKK
ncbi:MAG: hypothetical protein HIU83_00250 [Proteobacteria bacterium]|nr:hypothetical protein [Pseudomonadota bacterium]